ncbi:unnamed protein product [Nyctereutes procyonoides]|uniref:(raccoon dog) hypothetical protein n=1 Tax=Nyctereutes procyonoides TaxID=34880 RepID=A0A811Y1Q2_NYCPR|nr:unnamed protein product [Nyctereutes procyonoides]
MQHVRCYRPVVRAMTIVFVKCTKVQTKEEELVSQEHGLKYPTFTVNLIKCQVELRVDPAIYEPKTFKSLAALAKRR